VVDPLRVDFRALERCFRRDDAEIRRGGIAQRTAERSERGARAVNEDDFFQVAAP